MNIPEIGSGVALGIGGTNYRVADCDPDGNVGDTFITSTPQTPDMFFGETARRLLDAAERGASWVVLGLPGPVRTKVDLGTGKVMQNIRVTNVRALSEKANPAGFDPIAEMTKADPAIAELLAPDSGFTYLAINDGDLAVQAAAKFFASNLHGKPEEKQCDVVADLIIGTGVGGAIARRDGRFPKKNIFHPDPGSWEVGHIPLLSASYASHTYETTISGPALAKHCDKKATEIAPDDPIWQEVAHGVGGLVLNFAINGGAELVVVSGGTGVNARASYYDALMRTLDMFATSRNPQADKVPEVAFVPKDKVDTYELYGAHGAVLSHVTRIAVDAAVTAC